MSEYILNEAQEAWLKALESGEYEQATGVLHDGKGFCCLGVLCKAVGGVFQLRDGHYYIEDRYGGVPEFVENQALLRSDEGQMCSRSDLGLGGRGYMSLADANDNGVTFSEIAAFIRSNPTAVFKE